MSPMAMAILIWLGFALMVALGEFVCSDRPRGWRK